MPRKIVKKLVDPEKVIEDTLSALAVHIASINIADLSPKEQIAMFSTLVRLRISLRKGDNENAEDENENSMYAQSNEIENLRKKLQDGRKTY